MPVAVILKRWIEVLAATLFAVREAWHAKRSLTVSLEEGRFTIRQAAPDGGSVLAAVSPGTPVSDAVAGIARKGLVILELAPDKVVARRIGVPAQAHEFLGGIVRNQLGRLSPWQADQTVFGFDAKVNQEDASALEVRVLITSRTVIDDARNQVGTIGLPVDRIVARERGEPNASVPVLMWSRFANASPNEIQRASWLIGTAIAFFGVLSLGLTLWALVSTSSMSAENENLAARAKALQRQIQTAPTATSMASLNPRERAWVMKETSPSATILLEALSRALPDSAYLIELHLEKATLRIVGLASDAPSLIAPLERSGHVTDVHFFAPTTRGPDGTRFKFYIEARIGRQPGTAEPQPW
jgi:general secretion pathway protein L